MRSSPERALWRASIRTNGSGPADQCRNMVRPSIEYNVTNLLKSDGIAKHHGSLQPRGRRRSPMMSSSSQAALKSSTGTTRHQWRSLPIRVIFRRARKSSAFRNAPVAWCLPCAICGAVSGLELSSLVRGHLAASRPRSTIRPTTNDRATPSGSLCFGHQCRFGGSKPNG